MLMMKDCVKRKKWNMVLKAHNVSKMHLTKKMLKKKKKKKMMMMKKTTTSPNEMDVHLGRQ